MEPDANTIIDALGGTTAVAKELEAPVSTVHSWRSNGIPKSRLAHLKLVAKLKKIKWPKIATGGVGPSTAICPRCDLRAEAPAVRSCTDINCPLAERQAA